MPTPEFIVKLREKIGHEMLWLPGVTGVVFDSPACERVLLVERADNGRWALVTGILEPGEEPAEGLLREIWEETGIRAELGPLFDVDTAGPMVFPNRDECVFLNVTFSAVAVSGRARVNDDESTSVEWFRVDQLPESVNPRHRRLVRRAIEFRGEGADFVSPAADPAAGPASDTAL